jgi:hypothetical protein
MLNKKNLRIEIKNTFHGLNHMHYSLMRKMRGRVIVFNATLNNISVILWWSLLLVEETGVPGEN